MCDVPITVSLCTQDQNEQCRQCHNIEVICYPERKILNIHNELAKPGMHIYTADYLSKSENDMDCCGYVLFQKRSLLLSVIKIVVLPDARRLGIGRRLLRCVVEFATRNNIGTCSLHVEEENTPALSLYKSEGFVVSARLPDFYALGTHAFRMEKVLGF